MRLLYIGTAGAKDPTKASLPFHLAVNGSIPAEQEAVIALLGDASELILGEARSSLAGVGVPPLSELLEKVREHEIPVYV